MMDKAILTCALTGVLTNPKQHPVPVTPAQMAGEARDAFNAGASIMHVHVRRQEEGMGHLPSWDPDVVESVVDAIRAACPGVIINLSTGVVGQDIAGPLACIRRVKPEIAECKVHPEFECFDVGIVRSVGMYLKAGMLKSEMGRAEYNLVMGVASGMPCDADLLALIPRWMASNSVWQSTLIGRAEIWPVHQKTAELGGMLRSGLEDTFYLPGGERAKGNGELISALTVCARNAGRAVASPLEARELLGLCHS